jgi:hypothetical protein
MNRVYGILDWILSRRGRIGGMIVSLGVLAVVLGGRSSAMNDPNQIQVPNLGEMFIGVEPSGPTEMPQELIKSFSPLPAGTTVKYVTPVRGNAHIGWAFKVTTRDAPTDAKQCFLRVLANAGFKAQPSEDRPARDFLFRGERGRGTLSFSLSRNGAGETEVSVLFLLPQPSERVQ